MMPPSVAVILVHLNQEHHTEECLRSLLQATYPALEIIVVDNGSSDGSGDRLRQRFPSVRFVRNDRNLGFAEGNNVGIRIALGGKAAYVMLLNNDTIVDRQFVEPLLRIALGDPAIAVQSGKIFFFSEKERLWYAGGIFNVSKALGAHRGMKEIDSGAYDRVEDTGFATGCLMFFSRTSLEQIGLLDPMFFIYFEDADWCERARRAGYRVLYNPDCRIWHKVSTTTSIDSPFYLYLNMRNKILILRKHATFGGIFAQLPYLVYFYLRQLIRLSIKWRSWKGTKAVLFGLIDGLRNFTGPDGRGRLDQILAGKK